MGKMHNKKPSTHSTIAIVCAAVCAVLSCIYYIMSGNDVIVSIISAALIFGLAFLVFSFFASLVLRAIRALLGKPPVATGNTSGSNPEQEGIDNFDVVGTHYYLANIQKLATSNPDWSKTGKALASAGYANRRVYRYKYINKPVVLVREDNNPHDHNAVMVQIAGEKVGYISAEEAPHVRKILETCNGCRISGFIGGGDYKFVNDDGTFEKHSREPFVRVRIWYN